MDDKDHALDLINETYFKSTGAEVVAGLSPSLCHLKRCHTNTNSNLNQFETNLNLNQIWIETRLKRLKKKEMVYLPI